MGKYFDCYGSYRITHAVSDLHRNHPEFRNGIDSVIKGKQSQYTAHGKVVNSQFKYRFYADEDKDVVDVEITATGDDGVDVQRLFRIEREVEPIVSNLLRSPSEELVKHVTAEFNRSHGWSISEHEAKVVLMNIAEHVGR